MCGVEQGFYGDIEDSVPMPKQRRKRGTMPAKVKAAIAEYKESYYRLYGVRILEVTYKNGYIYVEGQVGISLAILRNRIRKLNARIG